MSLILGTDVLLQFLKDDSYQTFVCSTECSIQTTTELVDVRTINGGKWKKKRGKSLSFKVSLNGLIDLDSTAPSTFWLLENYQLQLLSVPFRMVFTSESDTVKIMQGVALIEASELTSSSTSFANSSFEFVGDGAYTIETATACQANIVTASVSEGDPEEPGATRVSYELANAVRLEYEVDGGGREVIFDPGDNGEFFIFDLTDGEHTLVLYAICETGAEGDSATINFNTAGGIPVDACAPPINLTMLTVTATSASCSWFALPAPADGYGYELENLNTGLIVQQGTQSGTTKVFSSLTPGTSYRVRIYSICELGVSVSAPTSKDFTTASATCNVPGAPVMSAVTSTTATATWTAASPAPADGYEWQVLSGVTAIDSGTTSSLSVNLTGLPSGSNLTFQVRSSCGGGQFSSYISTNFSTPGDENVVTWNFTTTLPDTTMTIYLNGIVQELTSTSGSSSFGFSTGDAISVSVAGPSPNTFYVNIYDNTAGATVYDNLDTSGFTSPTESLTDGHSYSITVTITEL